VQLHGVQDGVHRRTQVAVAAADLVELLDIDRRQLPRVHGCGGVQALEADLVAYALERQLAGGGALQKDHGEALPEGGELVALAGAAPALLINAASRAAIGQAQQLVEQVQQLVAALDHPACSTAPAAAGGAARAPDDEAAAVIRRPSDSSARRRAGANAVTSIWTAPSSSSRS
jgi:hypothetical protein